jgi:hypothetical protein
MPINAKVEKEMEAVIIAEEGEVKGSCLRIQIPPRHRVQAGLLHSVNAQRPTPNFQRPTPNVQWREV